MNQIDIRFYYSIFRRRLPLFILLVVLTAGLGVGIAYMLPPIYRADAKILIESAQISTDLVRSTVATEAAKQLQLIELQLMTRNDLVPIANRFDLYDKNKNLSADDIVDDMKSRTKIVPIKSEINQGSGTTAFSISFSASNPNVAANVVNEFVKLMLQRSIRLRTGQAGDTVKFFQDETDRLSTQLSQMENRILNFKKENKDTLPESLSFRRSQQYGFQERLLQIEREDVALREERSRLARIALTPDRDQDSVATSPKERTLEQFRRVLAEQRSVFSETSPGIAALRSQVAQLEKEVEAERANSLPIAQKAKGASEINLRLAEISQRLKLLGEEKVNLNENLANLSKSIAATPGVETILNALERERQSLQTQYSSAATRLADASAGQQIELGSKGERLSVLEPAVPPQAAVGPKRRMIALVGLAAGIGLGTALIVLMELLNRSVRRPNELVEKLGIEPLATIPYIAIEEAQPRRLTAAPALFVLAAIPMLLLMLHYYRPSLTELLNNVPHEHWIRRMF